ncbi:uracil-DNA glycosylase [Patulibacter brassicae]|uniref:Type-4 uracil-DNA glycosylase n=1 Tax=Patulibacter brassicae TaxID=1705717 RepID=A0ABU4VFI0_9ACTN|nr:uracil-DNA glycosylase [Patulibacter brassicae]MDX8150549.1 uracil-DNA glycosylase [Patulibacter brassicae]
MPAGPSNAAAPEDDPTRGDPGSRRAALEALARDARGCRRCPQLAAARTTVVFGRGDPDADLLLVGTAPGRAEDRQGLPLVGEPARLLDELLRGAGLDPDRTYRTTVLRCRLPDNRDPLPEEVAHCAGYLARTVELVRPRVVVALGAFATKLLRGDPAPIRRVHGRDELRTIGRRAVRLLPLYDPAAALYAEDAVAALRDDVARLPALLTLPVPPDPVPAATATAAAGSTPSGDAPLAPAAPEADDGSRSAAPASPVPAADQLPLFGGS